MPSVFRNGWDVLAGKHEPACLCHAEDPLLELLVPFSRYTQDHLTFFFFPCMEEEEGKIATGNRKHKIHISEDEKTYFSPP